MTNMSLGNIAMVSGGTYIGDDALRSHMVSGVVTDSRKVKIGDLYVALRGERVDGHSFIPDAFASGAAAALSEEKLEDPAGPYILVKSCLQALKDIAEFYRRTLSIPIIGIAGSVGKTGTKEMVASVLEQRYSVAKTEGNFNNEIGLPLTLLGIRPEHDVAVVEMGISEFGEMHRLAKMARPDVCVMTNIAPCHLENLIDLDGVLRAKYEMFDYLEPDGIIILNGNDEKLSTIDNVMGIQPVRYYVDEELSAGGTDDFGDGAGVSAEETGAPPERDYFITADRIVNRGLGGMEAVLHFPDGDLPISEPIPGLHNIYNACAAACVGAVCGLSHEEIGAGIASVKTLAGRANIIKAGDFVIIDDCYNASPNSMRDSLDILAGAEGRRIAVLGDMLELGDDGRELHRGVGAYAAGLPIDMIYCTGELSRDLADAARESRAEPNPQKGSPGGNAKPGCEARHFDTREELLAELLAEIRSGDVILVKASHSMGFSEIVDAIKKAVT